MSNIGSSLVSTFGNKSHTQTHPVGILEPGARQRAFGTEKSLEA